MLDVSIYKCNFRNMRANVLWSQAIALKKEGSKWNASSHYRNGVLIFHFLYVSITLINLAQVHAFSFILQPFNLLAAVTLCNREGACYFSFILLDTYQQLAAFCRQLSLRSSYIGDHKQEEREKVVIKRILCASLFMIKHKLEKST